MTTHAEKMAHARATLKEPWHRDLMEKLAR